MVEIKIHKGFRTSPNEVTPKMLLAASNQDDLEQK